MFNSNFAWSEVKEVIANSLFGCILSHKAFVLTP